MTWFFLIIVGVLSLAFFIDKKRKKNNNNAHIPTNPHSKPGDDSNYTMGDNRHSSGGE